MLICEMTAYYRAKGMTLSDALDALFDRYGYCYETNAEIYMEGLDGAARMAALMDSMRKNAPREFGGEAVVLVGDYLAGTITESGISRPTGLPSSDVLYYKTENGDVIVVRPSGTEPKIKFYYLLSAADRSAALKKCAGYQESVKKLID